MADDKNGQDNNRALIQLMDDMLVNTSLSPQTSGQFFESFTHLVERESLQWDEDAVIEHWSWLLRTGMITLTGIQSGHVIYPTSNVKPVEAFYVTPRGRSFLKRGEDSPHNKARFLAKIEQQIATPDEVVLTYLREGIDAWASGLNRASVVMVGCACEQLIHLLAEPLSKTNVAPYSGELLKDLKTSQTRPISISKIFKNVRQVLLELAKQKKLPGKLSDAIDRKLTPIFEQARAFHNAAGHPTAAEITAEDAEAGLLLFPGFYFFVNDVIEALAGDEHSDP